MPLAGGATMIMLRILILEPPMYAPMPQDMCTWLVEESRSNRVIRQSKNVLRGKKVLRRRLPD